MTHARRHAFTLIETLAVVALIGLAAVVMTPMLVGATDATRLDDALRRFLDLDARARLLARQESGVEIHLQSGSIGLSVGGERDAEIISIWQHGERITIEAVSVEGDPIERVSYDRVGRSQDLDVSVIVGDTRRSVWIAGLTGWVEREVEP